MFLRKKLKGGDYRCSFKTNCHGCCTFCKMPFVDKLVKQTDQLPWDTPYIFIARDFNHWKPWISPSQDISFWTNQFWTILSTFLHWPPHCLWAKSKIFSSMLLKLTPMYTFTNSEGLTTVAVCLKTATVITTFPLFSRKVAF